MYSPASSYVSFKAPVCNKSIALSENPISVFCAIFVLNCLLTQTLVVSYDALLVLYNRYFKFFRAA
jgi:hypothetical protein